MFLFPLFRALNMREVETRRAIPLKKYDGVVGSFILLNLYKFIIKYNIFTFFYLFFFLIHKQLFQLFNYISLIS